MATALLLGIGSLVGTGDAKAQVFLTFTGGNGTEVKITWSSPITYTLTGTTANSGVNPYFVFRSITNSQSIFQTDGFVAGVAPTYTSTGAGSTDGTQTINRFSTPSAFHDVANNDVVFRATADTAVTYLTAGDVITLSAGSLSYLAPASSASYSGALPANGYYNTIIVDAAYYNLGSGSAIPEPSTYAAIMGLGALGFVVWRRRRRANAAALAGVNPAQANAPW